MTNEVRFKVSGSELSAYMDQIQKKSDSITNSAIKGAREQTDSAKEQLKIINETISALEKKQRLESQSQRSILQQKRDKSISQIQNEFGGKRETIFADKSLSDKTIKEKIESYDVAEKSKIERANRDYQEELRLLREQDKQSKLSFAQSRESFKDAKVAAEEQRREIKKGNTTLDAVKDIAARTGEEEKLTANILEEQLEQDKRQEEKEKKGEKGILKSLLSVDNINKVSQSATQMAQTSNGFDAIQSTASTTGRIVGGILGAMVGSLFGGVGAIGGAAAGASMLGEIMGGAGAVKQKQAILTQDYLKARNKYNAITGTSDDSESLAKSMSGTGVSVTDFYKNQTETARARGYRNGSDKTAKDAIYAERAYGVDGATSNLLIELQRSSKENNRDLIGLIGGVLEKGKGSYFKGGDTTFLNEFLSKFTTLQKELLKYNTTVSTGVTMDVLSKFNSMGGMFDTRDSRSSGLISSINGGLVNPSSDNAKALAYRVLSKLHPGMGIFGLDEEMEKGYNSPGYMKGMMDELNKRGGSDDYKLKNLSGLFPGIAKQAIRTLMAGYKNGKIPTGSAAELNALVPEDILRGKAEKNTAPIERLTAEQVNKTLAGQPYDAAIDAISEALENAFSGAVITINSKDGMITLKGNSAMIKTNNIKKVADAKKDAQRPTSSANPMSYGSLYGGGPQ